MVTPRNFSWFDSEGAEMVRVVDGNVLMHNPRSHEELIALLECVAEFAILTAKTSVVIFEERVEAAEEERELIVKWLFSLKGSHADPWEISDRIRKGEHHKDKDERLH